MTGCIKAILPKGFQSLLCSLLIYKGVPVAHTFAAGMMSEVNFFRPLIRAKPLSVINSVWKGGSDREGGWGPRSQANGTEPKAGLGMTADGAVPISKELRKSAPHVLEIDAITQVPNLQ